MCQKSTPGPLACHKTALFEMDASQSALILISPTDVLIPPLSPLRLWWKDMGTYSLAPEQFSSKVYAMSNTAFMNHLCHQSFKTQVI